jgi:hypothetical protein
MCFPSTVPPQIPVNDRADVCSATALQRFDDAAAAQYPSAARYFSMLYSSPTFAAIAPAHRAAKAFSYHDSGQPWGEGPHPLSPEMQASYGPLPWSGEGCTCFAVLGPVPSLCPPFKPTAAAEKVTIHFTR